MGAVSTHYAHTTKTAKENARKELKERAAAKKQPPPKRHKPLQHRSTGKSAWDSLITSLPVLAAPAKRASLSMEDLMLLVAALKDDLTKDQGEVSRDSIQITREDRERVKEKALQAIETARQKTKEAKEAADKANELGWIQAIASLVGAILMTVVAAAAAAFTVGGAALAVAGAVVMLTTAIQGVANMALQETHATRTAAMGNQTQAGCSFADMVDAIQKMDVDAGRILRQDADGHVIDKNGRVLTQAEVDAWKKGGGVIKTAEDLAKDAAIISGVIEGLLTIGAVACGAGAAKLVENAIKLAAKEGANAVSKTARMATAVERWGEVGNILSESVSAVSGVVAGTYHVKQAELQEVADKANADEHFAEAWIKRLTQQLDGILDFLQHIVNSLNDAVEGASDTIHNMGETTAHVASNLVVRG